MSATTKEKRVLVVDDLPSTRMLVVDMLREMGFSQIIEASNGVEALKRIVDDKPNLIVCDYVMNGMSGVDLLRVLRTLPDGTSMPVIMLSSNNEVPFVDSALAAGATDYLVKPVSFNMLKRRIQQVFG